MKKTKKIVSIILLISIIISLLPLSISRATENEGKIKSTFKDLNTLINTNQYLDNKYSYGTLFWSSTTKIEDAGSNLASKETQMYIDEPISEATAQTLFQKEMEKRYVAGSYMVMAKKDESIKLKITDCAIDEKGDMCDILLEISNINDYEGGESATTVEARNYLSRILIRKGYEVTYNVSNTSTHIDCNLMNFSLYNNKASSDLQITYYKAGTDKLADIQGVVATIYDFDVPNPYDGESIPEYYYDENQELQKPEQAYEEKYSEALFAGNEGVVGLADTTYYYSENDYLERATTEKGEGISTPTGVNARLYDGKTYKEIVESAEDPDIAKKELLDKKTNEGLLSGTDGITTKTTAMLLQDQKAKFSMRYGGVGCGVFFVFVPLVPYEPAEPVKSVDVEETKVGEVFHYTASQYIPNNYNASLLKLNENSSSILYEEVVITDKLNENLEVAETDNDKIKVLDIEGNDISDWYTIKVDGNVVTATATKDILKSAEFYNQTSKLVIPIKVKEGCTLKEIPNTVTTTFKQNGTSSTKESNRVIVKVKYKVTLKVEVVNGEKNRTDSVVVEAGTDNEFTNILIKPNKGYKLDSLVVDGVTVDVSKLTFEKDGSYVFSIKDENIAKDIDHLVKAVCVKVEDEEEEVPDIIPDAGARFGLAFAIVVVAGFGLTRYRKLKK
ncbi:MAG: isopeptide-forming domain-containing fimbrial protein [Clostridia bacterium]|nr:isopeptide-forming domain-containing fimbrial protein [Clostridia bacterium]